MRCWPWKCVVALTGILAIYSEGSENYFTWESGRPYSDTFLYNGFSYKTIRLFDRNDSRISFSVAVASGRDNECPGPGRHCTTSLVLAENEGAAPFDLNPDQFEINCEGVKPKALKHYVFPRFLRNTVTASGAILLANTIFPGDRKTGAVIFAGTCPIYRVRIALEFQGRQIFLEFPFSSSHH